VIATRSGTTILPPDNVYPVFEGRIDTGGRTPTETTLTLEPAELWLPYAFGRAQFKTTDLVLSGADDLPKLRATIENNELVDAKSVEVVATIFDAAGNPLTTSQTFIEALAARSAHEVTFTWPNPIAKTLRSCEIPTDVIVAIDMSGSMNNDGANPPEPISSVLAAASAFVDQLNPLDQMGVVTFASGATTSHKLSNDPITAKRAIKSLVIDPAEERGTTNTGEGLRVSGTELQSLRHNKDARNVIVLLTDGLATAPGSADEPNAHALKMAAEAKADDVTIFTIGLGMSVNMDFLRTIASSPDQAYAAPTTATLNSIYQSITASICEDGAARIDVVPKTKSNFAPLQ
jgi:Mg-chelatase subunit ChlD